MLMSYIMIYCSQSTVRSKAPVPTRNRTRCASPRSSPDSGDAIARTRGDPTGCGWPRSGWHGRSSAGLPGCEGPMDDRSRRPAFLPRYPRRRTESKVVEAAVPSSHRRGPLYRDFGRNTCARCSRISPPGPRSRADESALRHVRTRQGNSGRCGRPIVGANRQADIPVCPWPRGKIIQSIQWVWNCTTGPSGL